MKYGGAAVLVATVIIAAVIFANPILFPTKVTTQSFPFLVMLTDPPTVPAGTTQLNLTYSGISLQVTFTNGTAKWLPVTASGTVNSFSLVNMSQTIASTTIPSGSTVERIQFTISSAQAKIAGKVYSVTVLSSQLIASIANSQRVNQTQGVLLDLNPTLVQIQATNSTGGTVNYFVLVPSATAAFVTNVNTNHLKVGTIVKLEDNERVKLIRVTEETSRKIVISSALLSVKDNVTNFSVTFTNQGNTNVTVFGLTLNGLFNVPSMNPQNSPNSEGHDHQRNNEKTKTEHPDTIPFRINGTSLVPHFDFDDNERRGIGTVSSLTIEPGKSITLSFSGVIQLRPENDAENERHMPSRMSTSIAITPIPGDTYTIRLMGEGFQTFNVAAMSS